MRRTRLIASLLAVVVLAAACGGDQSTTTTRDSAEQPDAAPEPELQPVRLGDRFSWCAELQADWDRHAQAQAQSDNAEAELLEAREAYMAAADELSRVDAWYAVDDAVRRVEALMEHLAVVEEDTVRVLLPGSGGSTDAETVALGRAREAFRASADPAVLSSSVQAHGVDWSAADLTEPVEPADEAPADTLTGPEPMLSSAEVGKYFADAYGGPSGLPTRSAFSDAASALLADAAGMAAFWASLSESCRNL